MQDFDEIFDWIIVGSGAGSMSSALAMHAKGNSTVILEKSPWVGGTTAKSGGVMWIPNNCFMAAGEDSAEKAMAYLDAAVGNGSDAIGTSRERRAIYVNEAPKMLDFIIEQGVEMERASSFWPDYYDELPGGCKSSRSVTARFFDKNQLGPWAGRLRLGSLEVPAHLEEGFRLRHMKHDWGAKLTFARIALRVVLGKLTGKHWVTSGAALQGRMLKAVLDRGAADIRTECPVSELILMDGRVTGVIAASNGNPWRIGARLGVLVNAGGFSMNQEMRDKYMPGTRAEWSNGIESDTGEMHLEMERVGGVFAQMDQMVGFQMTRAPGYEAQYVKPSMQNSLAHPHAILVDQSGMRYMNEGGSYELFCETQLKHNKAVPAVPSWGILDARFLKNYALAGINSPRILDQWRAAGHLKQADTIEGLATLIGVDPAALRITIDRWNGFVDKGADEDFHRGERAYDTWLGDPFFKDGPNASMGRIDTAPFHAIEVVPGDVGTFGGVITDSSARVLRTDGSPIDGLYACGICAASPMGGVYPGAGASIGPSMTFGWIAARHAAGSV